MQIIRKETLEVALIDPQKRVGEEGQYVRLKGGHPDTERLLEEARGKGLEIRIYIEEMQSSGEGFIPMKYVLTEIPPKHVQPFHSHKNVDEVNMIISGEIFFIESESFLETDVADLRKEGVRLKAGDAVVSEQGKRHTVANFSEAYAHVIGTISAKEAVREFRPDWNR